MGERLHPRSLGDLPTLAAREFGESPALAIKPGFRTRVTTYVQLEARARHLARSLQERGVAPGDRVLLWAPNSPAWVQCFFACHQIGAVLVPLDVRSSTEMVAAVVRKTEPKLAVLSAWTDAAGLSLPGSLLVEQVAAEVADAGPLAEPVDVDPEAVAEIMFTSGTTGDPKGVMLTHRNILSNVAGSHEVLDIGPHVRLLSLLPLSHMLEQTVGLLAPLSGGGQVVYSTSRQPNVLFRAIAEHRVTMLVLVPQALQLFLNAIERAARRQGREHALERAFAQAERLPRRLRRLLFRAVHARLGGRLETIICGGAALDPALAHRWELLGIPVLQGYGATEAAPIITCDRPERRRPGAVGTPFSGVEVRIAADGEVLARGPNIFPGYWRDPAATAQALADGWYHTGDLGALDPDGFLHLKGRKKDLIVLANGQNVYPEDIERALKQEPAVADAVVLGLEQDGGAVEVHAVLLVRRPDGAGASGEPAPAEARAAEAVRAANQRLAAHQQIQGYTIWPYDDFPRTHTLKVKKPEVLAQLSQLQVTREGQPVEAITDDRPLYRLLGEVSGVPTGAIQPTSTLGGDLGLDSLGRVELLSAVEADLGAYIDEAAIQPDTTVAELEARIAAQSPRPSQALVSWPLSPLGRLARELFLQLVLFPGYHLFWQVRVVGGEQLRGVDGPVLVAANHHFGVGTIGFDPAAGWMALPRALRRRTATAGEEHAVFDRPVRGFLARFLNAFPISQVGNVRGSLEYIGWLLDRGWSVLIFPEGRLTVGGPLQPFMGGTGLLAVESDTPVVPMYIAVERPSLIQGRAWPPRGVFTVHLGAPLRFPPGTSYAMATYQIEAAIRRLGSLPSPEGGEPRSVPGPQVGVEVPDLAASAGDAAGAAG